MLRVLLDGLGELGLGGLLTAFVAAPHGQVALSRSTMLVLRGAPQTGRLKTLFKGSVFDFNPCQFGGYLVPSVCTHQSGAVRGSCTP